MEQACKQALLRHSRITHIKQYPIIIYHHCRLPAELGGLDFWQKWWSSAASTDVRARCKLEKMHRSE
jgi:hypothetical protein